MSEEKTLMVVAGASIVGAVLSSIGHALGFKKDLEEVKNDVKEIKKCKSNYLTKEDHDRQCSGAKELTNSKLGRMEDKIDMILDRINSCQYQPHGDNK